MRGCRGGRTFVALAIAAAVLFWPAPLDAQEETRGTSDLAEPSDTRLYFEVSGAAPLLAPLLELHGCTVPAERNVRVELPGRIFEPPVELRPDLSAGRTNPLDALSTQWAALRAGDVDRAIGGWVPEERDLAESLLADSSAMERYRAEAAAIDSVLVDAVVWLDDSQERPVAGLLSTGGLMAWTLGMPNGYRRMPGQGFLMTIEVARDPRFAIIGAAVMDGGFGAVGSEETTSDAVTLSEACEEGVSPLE